MKIKIYILTYNNAADLNGGLEYFFNSDAASQTEHEIELNVINNHTNFSIDGRLEPYVKVWHNVLQPDFGTGHNSRNWNQAIVLGFQSLREPQCDLVITAHDDTWWGTKWLSHVVDTLNAGYTYMAFGLGDNIQVWTPQAVKRIGLWDERFSVLAMAEHDYFYRAALYNGEYSTINDVMHGRQQDGQHLMYYAWNLLPYRDEILQRPPVNLERQIQMNDREGVRHLGRDFFKHKWGVWPDQNSISEMMAAGIKSPIVSTYMFYPYFEKDIETLKEQNYLWNPPYKWY